MPAEEPPPNRPPVFVGAEDAETRAVVLHPFSYDVLEHGPFVTDPDGDPLTYTLTPSRGVLLYDKRVSITNTHACGSCHEQQLGFSSGRRFDTSVTGVPLPRNSMALTNVRYNRANLHFSDERVESLEQLVPMPIQNPDELGNSLGLLEQKLAATTFYPPLFEAAFGTPEITSERITEALAQFLRSLISCQSKHDKARAAVAAYTDEEFRGRELFRSESIMQPRCSFCHITDVQILFGASNNGLDAQFTDPGAGNGRFSSACLGYQCFAVSGSVGRGGSLISTSGKSPVLKPTPEHALGNDDGVLFGDLATLVDIGRLDPGDAHLVGAGIARELLDAVRRLRG